MFNHAEALSQLFLLCPHAIIVIILNLMIPSCPIYVIIARTLTFLHYDHFLL